MTAIDPTQAGTNQKPADTEAKRFAEASVQQARNELDKPVEAIVAAPPAPAAAAVDEGPAVLADLSPDLKKRLRDMEKRVRQMEELGKAIKEKKADIERQASDVATAKSRLDDERETLHELERELAAMQSDLDRLAIGGFAERLDFGGKKAISDEQPAEVEVQAAAAGSEGESVSTDIISDDEWRPLTLQQIGVKGALKDKLEVDGIKTFGDLADAFKSNKILGIRGVGDGSRSKLNDTMAEWWDRRRAAKPPQKLEPGRNSLVGPGTANAPAEQQIQAATLSWKPDEENPGSWMAPNFAGINDDEGRPFEFYVDPDGDDETRFVVITSPGALMPDKDPGTFATADEAKAWCEKRNAELAAAASGRLESREPTSEEFEACSFVPETAASVIYMLQHHSAQQQPIWANDILNDPEAFVRAWKSVEEVKPGSGRESEAAFNDDGYKSLVAAAKVLRKHHKLQIIKGIVDSREISVPVDAVDQPFDEATIDDSTISQIDYLKGRYQIRVAPNGIGNKYGHSPDKPGHDRPCRVATGIHKHAVRDKYWGKHADIGLQPMAQPNRMPLPGLKPKDLIGIPWRVALALQADGWYLRDCIIWHKPNPMPSSVTDRTTTAHEYVFLLTKRARYYYDADPIREPVTSTGGASVGKQNHDAAGTGAQSRRFASPEERNNPLGRNKRSVWTISTQSCKEAHFATYPMRLVEPCILAGTSEKGCCPHCGAAWRRIVERLPIEGRGSGNKERKIADGNGRQRLNTHMGSSIPGSPTVPVTIRWLSICKCPAHEPIPCTVLDPFSGAATTGLVAWKHGRNYVGLERKVEYIEISRRRLSAFVEKHTGASSVSTRPPTGRAVPQPSLFAEAAS